MTAPAALITNSRALERAALFAFLRTVEAGQTVTYEDMERVAGCSSLRANRYILAAARADLRDEEYIVFEPVMKVGMRRLTESERAVVAPDRRRRRSYRQASMGLKEINGIQVAGLSNGERQQFLGHLALLGAIAAVSSARALKRVLGNVQPDAPVLPVDQTLQMLADIR